METQVKYETKDTNDKFAKYVKMLEKWIKEEEKCLGRIGSSHQLMRCHREGRIAGLDLALHMANQVAVDEDTYI